MDNISLTIQFINILTQLPITPERKIALNLLNLALRYLRGEKISMPTKGELKITVDIIKDLKHQNAYFIEEHREIDAQAEYLKFLIDWEYKNDK